MLARLGDTWVITRANNRDAIEPALATIPERDRLHVVYLDLPKWARFWKRGQRGIRIYYLLWQMAALRKARRLQAATQFDLVWHLTFANAWLGSVAPLLGVPFIYGPVGGGAKAPWRLFPALGIRGASYELIRGAAGFTGRYLNPLARLAWRQALLIMVQNGETRDWFPPRYRQKVDIFPNTVLEAISPSMANRPPGSEPVAIFVGRLLPLKGIALAIRAIVYLPRWRMLIFGSGPDERRLRNLSRRLRLEDRVHFMGEVPRAQLFPLLREEGNVFIFPSLHDQASWALREAIACGLPVVALDQGGAGVKGVRTVRASTPTRTAKALAHQALLALDDSPAEAARLDLDSRWEQLTSLLARRGLLQQLDGARRLPR